MRISIVCILIYVIALCWCQDETEFHCSPKPGCQIAQCDPVIAWSETGFNIGEHLQRKEFPITCKSKNAAKSQNTGDLLPLVTRNVIDIRDIISKNQDGSKEINDLRKKNTEQSKQIGILEKENLEHFEEINKMKNDIIYLKSTNARLTEDLADQRKINEWIEEDVVELQSKNKELTEKNVEQEKINNDMKKVISRIERRLTNIEKSEYCQLKIGKFCYFTVTQQINYNETTVICEERGAKPALIRGEDYYKAIMNWLRRDKEDDPFAKLLWTGIQINPMTKRVTPSDSYIKWRPTAPITGSSQKQRTNVYLEVRFHPNDRYQGMSNWKPTQTRHGVICEFQN